jgi:hypothetical protein
VKPPEFTAAPVPPLTEPPVLVPPFPVFEPEAPFVPAIAAAPPPELPAVATPPLPGVELGSLEPAHEARTSAAAPVRRKTPRFIVLFVSR